MICCVTPITFAHRGARIEEPENTLAAFGRALDLGASGLETDARLSSEREVVLVHDGHVGSGRRRRRVASCSAAELAAYGVPRLADVYAGLGSEFELSIDLKVPGVAERILDLAGGAAGRLWLCSPDVDVLRGLLPRCARAGAHLVHSQRLGALPAPVERHASDLAAAGVEAMNFHHSEWTAALVALFGRFGVRAFAWDAQEVGHLRAVLSMGIGAVYCDRPDRMVSAVAAWAAFGGGGRRGPSEEPEA